MTTSPEPIEFETPRLRLRQWRASDREPFAALNAEPEVMEHFPAVLGRRASDAMADRLEGLIALRGWGLWAVEEKGGAPFVGFVGLHVPTADLPCAPCIEIAWRLARAHWGKGYATEAACGALRVGFDRLGFDTIVSFTAVGNRRSRAVMERIGMRDTGVVFDHPTIPVGHRLRPHCLYRITRTEWEAKQKCARQVGA